MSDYLEAAQALAQAWENKPIVINPDFQKKPPVILVVDDQKTSRLMLRLAMEKEGYGVREAGDGQQCLKVCEQFQPDMVLLDAVMPVMDGFTCCAQLQALLGEECPPVLIITVLDDRESVDKAFEVGATDYVTKPIHWPVLCQRVRRLLQTSWAMRQLRRQIEKERLLTQQLEAANRELQRLASIDGLTQLANRRCFDETLEREWQRLARDRLPISLILCDLDFFKAFNDTYGHPTGDECLRVVANIISQAASHPGDLAARYGGEELSLILPNTRPQAAFQIANTIHQKVKAKKILHAGSRISKYITLSLGVATFIPSSKSSPERLVVAADKALYQAKLEGRDRVVFYSPKLPAKK
ncbi:MAG TPA: PleD family two-component system response regulator [Kamptonema sp.]|nr:PleD family two-component system response regulator [Kamptonema sp.]